jgi:hypothetical protein
MCNDSGIFQNIISWTKIKTTKCNKNIGTFDNPINKHEQRDLHSSLLLNTE